MKRTLLVVSLCLVAGLSFAQKKVVKEAKSAMSNTAEAREIIKPALVNEETKNDPETWKVAGDIEYKAFDTEKTNEALKGFPGGKPANEELMYTGLYNMYEPYIKADQLGQLPNEKGKVKNKYRKDIIKALKEGHPYYINGGVHFNEKKEYSKAADFFQRYWELPTLEIFEDDSAPFNTNDSTYHAIKYYAVICAIQAEEHDRAIKMLIRMNEEGYVENSTYKESDPYELLASEYQNADKQDEYEAILLAGADKFPKNPYFTPNLINVYIKKGETPKALDYIDQAIKNDPSNSCDLLSVKASLYLESKEYDEAENIYKLALVQDSNCKRSLEGMGTLYIIKGQELKEQAAQVPSRREATELDEKAEVFYKQALEPLLKYKGILESENADELDMKQIYLKLQNVYYNMNMADELEAISKKIESFSY